MVFSIIFIKQRMFVPIMVTYAVLPIIIAAKVGIKSCRYDTERVSFVHVWM